MNVLVGCEFSGVVRDAFTSRGHNAWSCDLKPALNGGNHFQGDIMQVLDDTSYWDIIILHPECTAMALCGNKHYGVGMPLHRRRQEAVVWTSKLWDKAKEKVRTS